MKLHVPVSSAFPAVLATASALLLLVMLPAGEASVRSSSVAPALKLVAGDVVAAVESPVRAVSRAQQPKPQPAATPAAAASPTVQVARPAPVRRHAQRRVHGSRPRVVTSRQATTHAAPASVPSPPIAEHGQGKGKALGHVRKTATHSTPRSEAVQGAPVKGAGHAKTHDRPADVPHGAPAVPPGQAKQADAVEHGAPGNRGGAK